MFSNSVQIELFIILWVTKLIHNKQPMYAVLDKDTIKNEILPHLSVAKRGFRPYVEERKSAIREGKDARRPFPEQPGPVGDGPESSSLACHSHWVPV